MDITTSLEFPVTVRSRRRSLAALCAGVSFMHMAMIDASAVATLLFADAVGSTWSGAPSSAAVLGTALGTVTLSRLMAQRGRRAGLLAGYGIAGIGAGLAIAGVLMEAIPLVLVAMLMLGLGNGGAQLSRYAAAELYPAARRGFGLAAVVWAGTIGAVIGPALIAPAAGSGNGMGSYGGVFRVVTLVILGACLSAAALPRRITPKLPGAPRWPGAPSGRRVAAADATVKLAIAAMVTGQVVMAAVMTMTPVYMHHHGHGLASVGTVLSAHTLGMFALSPLSGRLTDRFGSRVVIGWGMATMASAALIAIAAPEVGGPMLPGALFLLGYGWNLGHVGGSALLSHGLESTERMRVQGSVDGVVWAASAVATLGSGAVFALGGYSLLGIIAGSLVIYPATVLLRSRRVVPQPPSELAA